MNEAVKRSKKIEHSSFYLSEIKVCERSSEKEVKKKKNEHSLLYLSEIKVCERSSEKKLKKKRNTVQYTY